MFYHRENNQYIYETVPFEINGVQYPANWLNLSSPEEKLAIGITEVTTTNSSEDSRYYEVIQHLENGVITYENIPKDLTELKEKIILQINSEAYDLLKLTDWYVIRLMETFEPIPTDWLNWRKSIRETASNEINVINNITTIDQLKELSGVAWPLAPNSSAPN